jgi:threonine/homoserine/homoserine lactone efflux protein
MSATGIGAVLVASYDLFLAVKWIGVAYLVWLGAATFFRGAGETGLAGRLPAARDASPARMFWGGFGLQMSNPAVLMFFTAFLPQFIAPHAPLLPQLAILGAIVAVIEIVVLLGYAALAGRFRQLLAAPRFARLTDRIAGALLIAAGLGMAAIRRT